MAKNAYAKIIWSKTVLEDLGFTDALDYAFAKYCQKIFKPYVPFRKGTLAKSVRIVEDKTIDGYDIVYDAPYAMSQYEGRNGSDMPESDWNRNTSVHPLATSYWDKFAIAAHKEQLLSLVELERRRQAK